MGSCSHTFSLKVKRRRAGSRDLGGCTQGVRASVRVSARCGLAKKARKVAEATSSKGRRGRAVHVRRFPPRARSHESQLRDGPVFYLILLTI